MRATLALLVLLPVSTILAQGGKKKPAPKPAAASPGAPSARADSGGLGGIVGGLKLRSIGPALTEGRISDIAVDPTDKAVWYVATAAGGVWKTINDGTSYTPIFDGEGSWSIGAITIDPNDHNVIWVGTGENNAQRVVAFGDGVYKSVDGGKSWKNVGLKESQHIGRIVVDPRNSDVVFVAAQGPLWSGGGDRGVFKTTDGGATWTKVLAGDDWTGANDIQLDPRHPDVLVATTWQRERRVYGFIAGGPGSAVWRSTDGGKTWVKSQSGFPKGDLGRIGLSRSPADPDVIYAIAQAADEKGGLFRSRDGGASWEKMSGTQFGGNYYNRVFADPKNVDRVYAVNVFLQISNDGGKTFSSLGEINKHVDNHVVWIDPDDTDHLVVGCDGGVYETFDHGKSWRFGANLPVTQYYRVATDNAQPFYNVYGGAQDNFSVGGPSRTRTNNGIRNSDWFITAGGDGFGSVVDPTDPNTVYAQSQFGNLVRFDLRTGEQVGIQPFDETTGEALRWNWDAPVIISPHDHHRLYFAAQRVYRSDDRGDSWRPVSPDLSRQIDRNALKMMGRVWGIDAVEKNVSTTLFGTIFTLAESPLKEGLLFAGTDDGRIQISEDGGAHWRATDHFPGVPDTTFVTRVVPSTRDVNTVYATFNGHWSGDFKPYVLKSTDLGRTWTNISGDLPERGDVWCLAEDGVDPDLLFVGTEFGLYFTADGGQKWTRLQGGLPTIQVRDLTIQRRENDLVLATFGRGFYVLDDYTPLRHLSAENLAQRAVMFPIRPAPLYVPSSPLGLPGIGFQGAGHYSADNPPYGAVFSYFLKDPLLSRKERRQKAEAAKEKQGGDVGYPSWDSLKAEEREEDPALVVTVSDSAGNVVRRFAGSTGKGINRVAWDLRLPTSNPVDGPPFKPDPNNPFGSGPRGPYVPPGNYQVSIAEREDSTLTPLGAPQRFRVVDIDSALPGRAYASLGDQEKVAALQREVLGASALVNDALTRVGYLKRAIDETPTADATLATRARVMENRLRDARELLSGDPTLGRHQEPSPQSLLDRLRGSVGSRSGNSLAPMNAAERAQMDYVRGQFGAVMPKIQQLIDVDLKALEDAAEGAGVPWTPGRMPKAP